MPRRGRKRRHLWWWFAVPLATIGLGSFPIILYGSLRTRTRWSLWTTPVYLGISTWAFADTADLPISLLIIVCMLTASAHATYLSYRFAQQLAAAGPVADPAIAVAQAAIDRRREAREILHHDPALAAELRIGRPDLDRTYDDGGLIDVNHVPAETLVAALEMHPIVAAEIVDVRSLRSGFFSADDLLVSVDSVNPDWLDVVRDRLVFVPRNTALPRDTGTRHALD